jgi:hypothetical protein
LKIPNILLKFGKWAILENSNQGRVVGHSKLIAEGPGEQITIPSGVFEDGAIN